MNLIAISGYKNSGKDLVGDIIRYLTSDIESYTKWKQLAYTATHSEWKIKKFASTLTKVYYDLTGIDYHNEPRDIKELHRKKYCDLADKIKEVLGEHVFVLALFNNYRAHIEDYPELTKSAGMDLIADLEYAMGKAVLPKWVITDCRFPNEAEAVKDRGGIIIRVNRDELCPKCNHPLNPKFNSGNPINLCRNCWYQEPYIKPHESETALDNYKFDYVIDNNSDIPTLIEKVKSILIKEKVL